RLSSLGYPRLHSEQSINFQRIVPLMAFSCRRCLRNLRSILSDSAQRHTMSNTYLDAITRRRSQYALGRNVSQSQDQVTALIQEAVRQAPSSFNSQSSRALILHGEQSV